MKENEKAKRERLTKDWQNATILNHFIFGRVMENKEICKQFLELVLKKEIEKIDIVEVEKHLKEFIDSRVVRLDVYIKGETEIYNIELQAKSFDDIAKRCRAHINSIDINLIKPGMAFKDINNVFIIFVCNFDPVGDGLPQYTVERRYIENLNKRFEDGTQIILLNAKAYMKAENKDLQAFLSFISGKEDIDNQFVNKIKKEIKTIKQNEKQKEKFMSLSMIIQDERYEQTIENIINVLDLLDDNTISKRFNVLLETVQQIRKENEEKTRSKK